MSEDYLDALLRSDEARAAWLAVGHHKDSAWFRVVVDHLRAYVRHGGDLLEGVGLILASVNADKARDIREKIDAFNRSTRPFIVDYEAVIPLLDALLNDRAPSNVGRTDPVEPARSPQGEAGQVDAG